MTLFAFCGSACTCALTRTSVAVERPTEPKMKSLLYSRERRSWTMPQVGQRRKGAGRKVKGRGREWGQGGFSIFDF